MKYFVFQAITETRDSCVLYNNRALTYIRLKLYKNALEDCEWALKVNEKSLKAWLNKAKAHYYLEEHEEYYKCLTKVKEFHPEEEDLIKGNKEDNLAF